MKRLLVVVATALAVVPSAYAAKPVPSLTPAATAKLWRAEVARAKAHPRAVSGAACRPARAVFYAQTDWLRLATKLAQSPSPCAQYFVSVPSLAADKTQARANQAAQIRALGPSFHALDEINFSGWSSWVSANGSTWYDAGVLARQRMTAAGFDASAGDTWALNEASSAVRKGTGSARQNLRDFLRGLGADGVKGVVFVSGIAQPTADLGVYKVNLQSWLEDSAFWSDVAQYVSDWHQETYGDVRNYAAAGTSPQQRRDALEQYLGHEATLAGAGPASVTAARGFLQTAYGPLANAAWAWSSAYGYTSVPFATMQDYVSAQIYASRALSAAAPLDRLGFAWAPSNTLGLTTADYNAQTSAILDRLGSAVRDSGTPTDDPGFGACAPSWCTAVLDGASLTTSWQTFATWSDAALAIGSPPATLTAGSPAGPLTVQLQRAGVPDNAQTDQAVTLTTSSAGGSFSTSGSGPWSPTLTVTIPTGSSSVAFYYSDTVAGQPTLAAALAGLPAATQSETVNAGPLARIALAPGTATVAYGKSVTVTAAGSDAYGNAVAATPAWTLSSTAYGRLSTATGPSAKFTAGSRTGAVIVTASSGGVSAAARISVVRR